jgi:predicted dehydrogenase
MRTPVTVGVVCGPNGVGDGLARVFDDLPQASLRWVCDDARRASSIGYGPATAWTMDFDELLQDEDLDAIVFGSSDLAGRGRMRDSLAAEKHVFVDGPLASSSAESDELVELAARGSRRLMASAPVLLRPEVQRLHRLIDRGALGEIFYVHARRFALPSGTDAPLLRTLGLEVVSLLLDLLGDEPVEVHARGESYLGRHAPDVVVARLGFATGIAAFLHLSNLEGESADRFAVVGSKATAVLDGADPEQPLSVCLNGSTATAFDELPVDSGDRVIYRVAAEDPLRQACSRFVTAIRSQGELPFAREASAALAVVEALEASVLNLGAPESVSRRITTAPNVVAFRGR